MEIVQLPIVIDKKKLDSRFRLIVIATERARKLINGAKPCVPLRYLKESTVALEELVSCDIEIVRGKDARKAIREAMEEKETKATGAQAEAVEEDETKKAIEEDLGVYINDAEGNTGAGGE